MRKSFALFTGVLVCVFILGFGAKEPASQSNRSLGRTSSLAVDRSFGKMPLYFVRNEGQVDSRVGYYVQGKDKTIYFTPEGLTYVLSEKRGGEEKEAGKERALEGIPGRERESSGRSIEQWIVKLDFVGANRDVRPSGEEKTEAVISYFKGKPDEWKTGLPTYSRIVYRELWPGVDLAYYGTTDRLKYEFVVHPGVDPSRIRLAYRGAGSVQVNEEGRLEVMTPTGGFEDDVPVAWQEIRGQKVEVPVAYELSRDMAARDPGTENTRLSNIGTAGKEPDGSVQEYGFQIGEYDRTQTLILDPAVIVYCGYIGGSEADFCSKIAVDSTGNAYVSGSTNSTEASFPVTTGPDLTHNDSRDAFVAKVNSSGTELVYCGYIGGDSWDQGAGLAIDNTRNAYITGWTASDEDTFPVTTGPDLSYNGASYDAFVAKVNSSGTGLVYCGYIGGLEIDHGRRIALDGAGNAYIMGETDSTEASFPVAVGPDLSHNGLDDAFVAKVNSSGTALSYCGYIGGSNYESSCGIAVESGGNVYVAGYTESSEDTFPVMTGPDLSYNGLEDAFVAKLNSSAAVVYCGYLGGSGDDNVNGIDIDSSGNAYVAGWTDSGEDTFPVTIGPDLTYNDLNDAFVAKVNSSGTALSYCGYIGGSRTDLGLEIASDSAGNAYVTGGTYSGPSTFPVKTGPDLTHNGDSDAFVAKVNSPGTALVFCGYIGGSGRDSGNGIAVDYIGDVYIVGSTESIEDTFPVMTGPDLTHNGAQDTFVAKISVIMEDDLLGTWDGSGVWYRNTVTGDWVSMTSVANLIASGDIDNDGTTDLIGVWASGLWVRYSSTGSWAKLSANLPTAIASGDMSGDGRDDVVGSWTSGVWYRNSATGTWVLMSSSPASLIAAGYIDADAKEDLIGVWGSGLWVRYSAGPWVKLSGNLPTDIASGNMDGTGRDEVVGSWASGIWSFNPLSAGWTLLCTDAASQVTAGDYDGDRKEDLIGVWASGLWVKKSSTMGWMKIPCSNLPRDIDAGLFRTGETAGVMGFPSPFPIYSDAPGIKGGFEDLSNEGPGGSRFRYDQEENLVPFESYPKIVFGPGDPGLRFEVQENLVPGEDLDRSQKKEKKQGINLDYS